MKKVPARSAGEKMEKCMGGASEKAIKNMPARSAREKMQKIYCLPRARPSPPPPAALDLRRCLPQEGRHLCKSRAAGGGEKRKRESHGEKTLPNCLEACPRGEKL